jgi:hypothetical protein
VVARNRGERARLGFATDSSCPIGHQLVDDALDALADLPQPTGDLRHGQRVLRDNAEEVPAGDRRPQRRGDTFAGAPAAPGQLVDVSHE